MWNTQLQLDSGKLPIFLKENKKGLQEMKQANAMRKLAMRYIFVITLLMNPANIFAQSVERILFKGSELLYPIPKGFCNITEDIQGIMMKELIDKQKNPMLPVAQLIVAPCERSISNPGYPWGWIGLMKDGSKIPQETLNRMMARILKNEDLIDKLEKQVKKKGTEVFNELFGVEAKLESNEQKIIWADKDSILVAGKMSGKLDGTEIKEVYVTSTTAIGDLYVYSYLYNLEGGTPSVKQLSQLLINNAPRFKDLN